ncbi:MAG: hypothetical protein P8P83_02735 [Rickettsiaceae bacterium]|nr:hypothetical protein [Rickettsiaceae bacterium]
MLNLVNINTFVTLINNNPSLTIDSPEIQETDLYKALINANEVNLSGLLVKMEQNELFLLMQIVANSKILNNLDLSANDLDGNQILNCINILKDSSLKSINISNNQLSEESTSRVIQGAQTIPSLNELNLSVDTPANTATHVTLPNGIVAPIMPSLDPVGVDLNPCIQKAKDEKDIVSSDGTQTALEKTSVLTRINWTNIERSEVCIELRNYTDAITELNKAVIQSQIQILSNKLKEPDNIEYRGQSGTIKNLKLLLFYSQNCEEDIFKDLNINANDAQLYYAKNFFALKSLCKSSSHSETDSSNNKKIHIEHTATIQNLPEDLLYKITEFLGTSEIGDKIYYISTDHNGVESFITPTKTSSSAEESDYSYREENPFENRPTLEHSISESSAQAIDNYNHGGENITTPSISELSETATIVHNNGGESYMTPTNMATIDYQNDIEDNGFGLTGQDTDAGFSLFGN